MGEIYNRMMNTNVASSNRHIDVQRDKRKIVRVKIDGKWREFRQINDNQVEVNGEVFNV